MLDNKREDIIEETIIHAVKVNKLNAINFAVAASCLKYSIEHDFNLVSVAAVENLAKGNSSCSPQFFPNFH